MYVYVLCVLALEYFAPALRIATALVDGGRVYPLPRTPAGGRQRTAGRQQAGTPFLHPHLGGPMRSGR
jgi:hypothetical protein